MYENENIIKNNSIYKSIWIDLLDIYNIGSLYCGGRNEISENKNMRLPLHSYQFTYPSCQLPFYNL